MTDTINTRELIMNILLEMDREKTPCHLAVRDALDKYQFLPRQELVFIEGVPYSKMAGRFLPVHLKQNVHNQLSCIDCISHHFS